MIFGSGLVTVILAAGLGVAAAATPAASPAPAGAVTSSAAAASATRVVSITGDAIRLRALRGATVADIVPAHRSGAAGSYQRIVQGARTYLIPADARPYLGTVLDPELFDVAALANAGQNRIPVRISSSARASVPGVHLTSHSAGAASGYLTAASARTFGAALAAQYKRDAAAGFPRHSSLFGATRIALAAHLPVPTSPNYPMRTLIIKVVDANGAPAPFAFLDVYNTDSLSKYFGFAEVVHGVARVSVPTGTYGIDTGLDLLNTRNQFVGESVLIAQGIKVASSGQVVTLDARDATSKVSVHTPKPAGQIATQLTLSLTDKQGSQLSDGYANDTGSLYVQPTAAGAEKLTSEADFALDGTSAGGRQYVYQLRFPGGSGIPADQS